MEYDEYYRTFEIEEIKQRAHDLLKDKIEERYQKHLAKLRKWNDDNSDYLKQANKEYAATAAGKAALQRRAALRYQRLKHMISQMTDDELADTEEFYFNRPEGMEVDHIIPLCKGGSHHVSNLQYVTPRQNRKKAAILNFNLTETI